MKKLLNLFIGIIAIPYSAFAQSPVYIENPLKADSLKELGGDIVNGLLTIAGPLLVIMILIGGFQILTAAGDPAKFTTGKKTIMYAAIGFIVIVLANSLIAIFSNLIS